MRKERDKKGVTRREIEIRRGRDEKGERNEEKRDEEGERTEERGDKRREKTRENDDELCTEFPTLSPDGGRFHRVRRLIGTVSPT